ncbi:hypothetical protein RJ40_00595 [Methanofollis aquaemaris]|uniref:Uncharacterized protein n=1 Tax=Methanofollis aquaemaris TaxID=126734 RepID=A0A8A3S182_9EURY|nr:hypothetical protein [Methanofollis aquaemaris]QSZ66105.1 hypothetical protein RJ40_00595 [Methanofollis aquaemaris]
MVLSTKIKEESEMKKGSIYSTALVLLVLLCASAFVMPASASDWIDLGTKTAHSGDNKGGYAISVDVTTHYWYNPTTEEWKVHIKANGGAQIFKDSSTPYWQDTSATYGVYGTQTGYMDSYKRFGDEDVWYAETIEYKQMNGFGTIYEGTKILKCGPGGHPPKVMSITVAGVAGSSCGAQCYTSYSEEDV